MKSILLSILIFLQISLFSQQKVGVVLSGGGASGMAHIGFLKALEENNIPIDYITGTSIGAFIGGMYAAGYSPTEIEAIVTSKKFIDASNGVVDYKSTYYFKQREPNSTLISWKFNLDSTFEANLPTSFVSSTEVDFGLMELLSQADAASKNNFDSLMIPFRCIASNITERTQQVFSSGELPSSIRASMTYPFYISPIEIDGKVMFDGGLYNNFPADILCQDFHPDFIIASNVTSEISAPSTDNLLSQLKSMLMKESVFTIACSEGIIVNSEVTDISTFEFEKNHEAINRGYSSTLKLMDSILFKLDTRVNPNERENKRLKFKSKLPPLIFSNIDFTGLHPNYTKTFNKKAKRNGPKFKLVDLRKPYFQLATDDKIKRVYPRATFNPLDSTFNLKLAVEQEKNFSVSFGGIIASKPFSTGFFELDYKNLSATELTLNGNIYFGGFYNSAQGIVRWDVPFSVPLYLSAKYNINSTDYFSKEETFIDKTSSAYIINSEQYADLSFGFPIYKKGKISFGANYAWQDFNYYQNDDFERGDTSDLTEFNNFSYYGKFQINSLDKKMYASKGSKIDIMIRHIKGKEKTTPGSNSLDKNTFEKNHQWIIAKIGYEGYFFNKADFHIGTSIEAAFSDQNFFQNHTATILNAPAYRPIPETKTLFQSEYRAFTYFGAGLKFIYAVNDHLEFRLESYLFQPYEELGQTIDRKTILGAEVKDRDFLGTFTTVYHTRLGPLAANLNYYDGAVTEVSFLIHFGYLLFNNGSRD